MTTSEKPIDRLHIRRFQHNTPEVEAVQVTAENAEDVASTFGGTVHHGIANDTLNPGGATLDRVDGVTFYTTQGPMWLPVGGWVVLQRSPSHPPILTGFHSDEDMTAHYREVISHHDPDQMVLFDL